MLHAGFDALCAATDAIDLSAIEAEIGIRLPESYKRFLDCYKVGKGSLRKEYFHDERAGIRLPLISYRFDKGGGVVASLDEFVGFPDAIHLRATDSDEFTDARLGLMRIVFTNDAGGGGIYIGLKENNFGRIFKASWDFAPGNVVPIAADVFDFVKGIKSAMNDYAGIEADRLVKGWNDPFWRVTGPSIARRL